MRLRFIGQNGSMGLTFGRIYRLKVEPWKNGVRATSGGISCPYESDKAFWDNWCHPDLDIRTVMEEKGRALRSALGVQEPTIRPCHNKEWHEPHIWTDFPKVTCPGVALSDLTTKE